MELIMSTTLGEDWRSFFDMVIANARKSYFWPENNSMHIMDQSKFDFKGPVVAKGTDVKLDSSVTYLEGSARIIEELVESMKPGQEHKYLYFGDQYLSDVYLC